MDDRYYLTIGAEQKGPYTFSQLQSMWRSGAITSDMLYCQQGFDEWVSISSLAQLLDGQPAPTALPAQYPALGSLGSDKRILPALILCFFLGVIGAHAFYAGRPRQGILFLAFPVLTFSLVMVMPLFSRSGSNGLDPAASFLQVWVIIGVILVVVFAFGDLIRILVGAYKDGQGRKITRWT